mgnify:CR=1 FL=1
MMTTPAEQILIAAQARQPVWPDAFHQAVRALGYTSYTIDRVHAHPSKPYIEFEVFYGFRGDTCSDEHSLPFTVFNHPNVAEEVQRYLSWARFQEAQAHVEDLERQLIAARQECDKAQEAFQAQMTLYGHEEEVP